MWRHSSDLSIIYSCCVIPGSLLNSSWHHHADYFQSIPFLTLFTSLQVNNMHIKHLYQAFKAPKPIVAIVATWIAWRLMGRWVETGWPWWGQCGNMPTAQEGSGQSTTSTQLWWHHGRRPATAWSEDLWLGEGRHPWGEVGHHLGLGFPGTLCVVADTPTVVPHPTSPQFGVSSCAVADTPTHWAGVAGH